MNTCIGYLSNFANLEVKEVRLLINKAISYNVRTTAATSIALGYQLVGGSSGTIHLILQIIILNILLIICYLVSNIRWKNEKEIENENTGLSFIKINLKLINGEHQVNIQKDGKITEKNKQKQL